MLKKYILYAKRFVHPKLSDIDRDKITHFYTELRRESSVVGGIPVGVRHVESILRMAESHARMHLREYVRVDDVDLAIKMMLQSFLMTQKYQVARALSKKFSGYLTREQDAHQLLLHILNHCIHDKMNYMQAVQNVVDVSNVSILRSELEKEARDANVTELDKFFSSPVFTCKYILENGMIKLK